MTSRTEPLIRCHPDTFRANRSTIRPLVVSDARFAHSSIRDYIRYSLIF